MEYATKVQILYKADCVHVMLMCVEKHRSICSTLTMSK